MSAGASRPRRMRAALLLLAVFLAGAAAGAAALSLGAHAFRSPETRRGRALERLTRELGLDAAQRAEVEAILDRQRTQMRPLFEESRRQIRGVLRPDQQRRFDAMPRPGRRRPAPQADEKGRFWRVKPEAASA